MKFNLKWWELLVYETALLSLGVLIGAKWSHIFSDYLYLLLIVFAVLGGYILYALMNQIDFGEK